MIIIPAVALINLYSSDYNPKEAIVTYMKNNNCEIINIKETTTDSNTDVYYQTDKNTCPYKMDYIEVNNDEMKEKYINKFTQNLIDTENITKKFSKNSSRYFYQTVEGDDYNILLYKNDNIIYLSAPVKYKTEIMSVLADLGYINDSNDTKIDLMDIIYILLAILLLIFMISWWKLNKKMNRPGWISLIPIYNIMCLSEDIFGKKVYGILLFVPIINLIYLLVLFYNIGKVFEKSKPDSSISYLFPINLIILAFNIQNIMVQ